MKKLAAILCVSFAIGVSSYAQIPGIPDTTNLYGEKKDSLSASVKIGRRSGNYLSKGKEIRTEVISSAGLCKMACCNLAESFENSASVTVGYSDAVTGARQIRLLGQSGIYTQMLDENRPVMRGLSSPWGLTFIPSQWLESIQIAKGSTSVINGVESMTGQINLEHRKPTDEKPLFLQASFMSDTKTDINIASSLQLDEEERWSTVILGHVDGNFKTFDHNDDGFMDDPKSLQFNISNRWLYYDPSGLQLRFGVRAIQDRRNGGEITDKSDPWQTDILNRSLGAYAKIGIPLNELNSSNIAAVIDYNFQKMDASFGHMSDIVPNSRQYDAGQHSAFINLLYQNQDNENHHFTLGLSNMLDSYNERFNPYYISATEYDRASKTMLNDLGVFGEYTFHSGEVFSAIAGLRADWFNSAGVRFSPRLTLKWSPNEYLTFRANGGRGIRFSTPIVDNIGILSTGKTLYGDFLSHPLEDAWTFGGNVTWYIGGSSSTYLSFDYFSTRFTEQLMLDYTDTSIEAYLLSDVKKIKDAYSYTDNFQLDFSIEPLERFTLTLTGRYTNAKQTLMWQENDVKPMTSKYKAVLNLQYATNLNKWIFDFTASVNGPCKVWDFMKNADESYKSGYTPVYPLLYAQVTKRFKGFDIYIGGENLTGFTQKMAIISAEDSYSSNFDASCIWGPLMGAKFYCGVRMTIWKTE